MTVSVFGNNARRAWLFGQGNILAFPQTVLGIIQAIPDLVSSKSTKRDRSFAAIDIVSGIGGIGRAFSNTISLISFFHPIANFLLPFAGPISIAGSGLSAIYAVGLYFNHRQASEMLSILEGDSIKNGADLKAFMDQYTDHDLTRIFNMKGEELKGRIHVISQKNYSGSYRLAKEAIISRLEDCKRTFRLGIVVSIISVIAAVTFFLFIASPLLPVAIAVTGVALVLQIYNAGTDYVSNGDFERSLYTAAEFGDHV